MIGQTLGSYTIRSEIGVGGMGRVYAAEHELIGRQAAVKLLLPELSQDKQLVDRFFNEARASAVIKNPGIVDIYDFGYAEDGSAYLIMELLDGESLGDRLDKGRLPDEEVLRIGRQVASTLAAVHQADIIHRDLKPDNIFLVPDSEVRGGERAKILDFGIAKLSSHRAPGTSKTQTGQVMGSPLYMSPEQCRGAGEVDARADIYSLGCILYEMACGRPLFDGEGVGEVLGKQIYEQPEAPRSVCSDVSPRLEAIVLRALAKDPDDRYATMDELVDAIEQATGEPASSREPNKNYDTAAMAATEMLNEPPRVKVLTTLGKGATQMDTDEATAEPPAQSSNRWLVVAVGVAAVAAAAVFATTSSFSVAVGGNDGPAPPEPTTSAAAAASATATATEPTAEPSSTATAEPEQTAVTVAITSVPAGAIVYRVRADGTRTRLGPTPYRKEHDRADADLAVVLELEGYQTKELIVPLKEDYDREVVLQKSARGGPLAPPTPPPTPTATPQPPPTAPATPTPTPTQPPPPTPG
ncbi:MAG: serine/threonine protein kinase, partial [Deltaproteobacteria bacterium]|nr:serine/threonine protein kinase [Deltaproteobacteria bacterium]MBW2532282.1 serine/threonine protein kinase [Deltaproteobacteria bacterium]